LTNVSIDVVNHYIRSRVQQVRSDIKTDSPPGSRDDRWGAY
jgi:hypothetical protein